MYDKGESKVPLNCVFGAAETAELIPLVVGREDEKDAEPRGAPA